MSEAPVRGRPRSEASRRAILSAAFDVLRERGYAGMALEAVAARASVGKATIYRWWPGRAELATEAFFEMTQGQLAFPDTGSAREDFRAQIHAVGALLRGAAGPAMAAMTAGALTDPVLAQALRERWIGPRMRWGLERLARAAAAGEARPGIDHGAALAVLYSPLYARLPLGVPPMSEGEVEAYLGVVLPGIFP